MSRGGLRLDGDGSLGTPCYRFAGTRDLVTGEIVARRVSEAELVELEEIGRQSPALGMPLALLAVDDDSHRLRQYPH